MRVSAIYMEKTNMRKVTSFVSLKTRSVKTIREHKVALCQIHYENKNVVIGYDAFRLSNLLRNAAGFTFFIKLNFFCEELRFSDFLSVLRNNRIDYLIVDVATFKDYSSNYFDFFKTNMNRGHLLIINTFCEEEYCRVMDSVLQLEQDLNNNTVNYFRLLFVRERSFVLQFNLQNSALRKLYELKNTKQSILLETLNTLSYPTLMLINGTSRVAGELGHLLNVLHANSYSSSEIK
jgi:hypothetical protein